MTNPIDGRGQHGFEGVVVNANALHDRDDGALEAGLEGLRGAGHHQPAPVVGRKRERDAQERRIGRVDAVGRHHALVLQLGISRRCEGAVAKRKREVLLVAGFPLAATPGIQRQDFLRDRRREPTALRGDFFGREPGLQRFGDIEAAGLIGQSQFFKPGVQARGIKLGKAGQGKLCSLPPVLAPQDAQRRRGGQEATREGDGSTFHVRRPCSRLNRSRRRDAGLGSPKL